VVDEERMPELTSTVWAYSFSDVVRDVHQGSPSVHYESTSPCPYQLQSRRSGAPALKQLFATRWKRTDSRILRSTRFWSESGKRLILLPGQQVRDTAPIESHKQLPRFLPIRVTSAPETFRFWCPRLLDGERSSAASIDANVQQQVSSAARLIDAGRSSASALPVKSSARGEARVANRKGKRKRKKKWNVNAKSTRREKRSGSSGADETGNAAGERPRGTTSRLATSIASAARQS